MSLAWPLTARGLLFEHLGRMYADRGVGGVVVTGPAGVGKTRLVEELLAAAGDRPVARIVGHPATQSIPLGAMAHLLPADLTSGIGIGDDDRAALFHRARRHLAGGDDSRRTLFVADDVDQLDETTLAVLMPFTVDRSIFLVATLRSGRPLPRVLASLLKDEHVILEALPPLARDQVVTLLHRVLDGPIDTGAVDRLVAAADGNLQILRELVHLSLEQGRLRLDGGTWVLDDLPRSSSLEELVASQLADLDPDARDVLDVLALAGSLGLAELEAIAGKEVLLRLDQRGLIRVEVDDRRRPVRLSHPLYGETIRSRLGVLRERQVLRDLADRIDDLGARRRGDQMQLARWRLDAGGEIHVDALLDAGRLAVIGRETVLAVRFAVAAEEGGRHLDAAIIRLEAAVQEADIHEVERVVSKVWDDPALTDTQRSLLATRLARTRFAHNDLDGALRALEAADDRVRDARSVAALRADRALLLATNGRPTEALFLIADIDDLGDPRIQMELANARSISLLSTGRMSEAIHAARTGSRLHATLPESIGRAGAASHVINEAHALGYSGHFADARSLTTDALRRARASGARAAVVWFEVVLGEIERDSGNGSAAIRHFTTATELAEQAGQQSALVWAWVGVAQGHLILGQNDPAAAALEHADACSSPIATSWSTRERTRAWLLASHGDLRGARAMLTDLVQTVQRDGMSNFEAGVVHDLVRFGDPGAAVERLTELAQIVEGPYVHALAEHARAATDQDLDRYETAIAEFETMDCLVLAAEAAIEASELFRRNGDQRSASAMGQRALNLVGRSGGARTPGLLRGTGVEPLTEREREVALLAAGGMSSKAIASRLVVSKRTIDSHLDRIYRKLGVAGREHLSAALASSAPSAPPR